MPVSPVRVNGRLERSTLAIWSNRISVLKRSACCRKRCIRSGPCTPCTSAGQLSTSVVVISWPPWARPVMSAGLRLARAA
ncbi:Uncharacterised protein [Bordetella pertussis]|nr:Uncharacterised protein [Bordetella pertussis]